MPTVYPGAIDNFTNPTPANNLDDSTPTHSGQHSQVNDAIEAIETKLGTSSSQPATGTALVGTGAGQSAWQAITHNEVAAANKDGAAGTPSLRTLGSGAQQAAAGNHTHGAVVADYAPIFLMAGA